MNTKKESIYCKVCNAYIGEKYKCSKSYKKTCSDKCHDALVSLNSKGENNNNFRHGYTVYGKKCPKCKGPVSLGAEKYCMRCTDKTGIHGSFFGKKHKVNTLNIISKASKEKWTKDFTKKFKLTMIDNGHWIDPKDKSDIKIYFELSNWIESMFNRNDITGTTILKESGVFNMLTNSKGCVRDHKFSRKSGFEQRVYPELLRHPCNCQLISHGENVKKRLANIGHGVDNIVSLKELLSSIKEYKGDWKEQGKCLELIGKYEQGKKWKRA